MITKEAIEAAKRANTEAKLFGGEPDDWVRAALEAALPFLPIAVEGKAPEWWQDEAAAEREFTEYFVRNYPDPVCDDPEAHAAKLFRAAKLALLATNVLPSSPGKDGGQEVEAVKTVWQVADAIDPERSPDGGWRDQLLNEIHADLENRGRRDKDFAVTVHHRNIVISAVSKTLRGLPSVSKEAAPMKDHARGCEGRNYTCTCGHDAASTALVERLTSREGDDAQD